MTAKEAKEKTLHFFQYIAAHPEVKSKSNLPIEMRKELKHYYNTWPLCQFLNDLYFLSSCDKCPLEKCTTNRQSPYYKWMMAETDKVRQRAANQVVARVEAWEPVE
jgi:hypothetical protein